MDQRDYREEFKQKLHDQIHQEVHDRINERMPERMVRPRLTFQGDLHWGFIWGLIIAAVGLSLLLQHMGVISFNPVVRFWPSLLILFGLMNLLTHSGRFFGFLLILVGAVLQLNTLGYTSLTWADLWPIALIAVGLLLMWGSLEARGFVRAKKGFFDNLRQQLAGAQDGPSGALNAVAIFGGCERRISSKQFAGGKATAVFGGIELDFRDADMEGEVVLEVNCVLGGVEIRVPQSWHVHSRNIPVFGGYEDTTHHPSDVPGEKPKTLIITGMVVFGGVEIKN